MNLDLLERRRELLKTRNYGVSLADAVKDLATKYHVSTRVLYHDWQNRREWIEDALDVKDTGTFFFELVANHREIQRLASLEFLQGDNSNARIGALRLMRDMDMDLLEMVVVRDNIRRLEKLEEKARKGGIFL